MAPYLLVLLSAVVIAASVAMGRGVPDRDSGVFLYVARAILRGQTPYLDVWDHKPPLIYYIDALALSLGRGLGALWALEIVSLCLAALGGYIALRRCYGAVPALTASILWILAAFPLLGGGNFTEEFGLACAFGTLWAASHVGMRRPDRLVTGWPVAAGLFCALELLCKPTGVGLAIGLVVALACRVRRHGRSTLVVGALALAGFVVPIALTAIYFATRQALPALIDEVITYNRAYAHARSL